MTCEGCDLNEAVGLHQATGQQLCEMCIAAWDRDMGRDRDEEYRRRHEFCTPLRQAVKDYQRSRCSVRQESDGTWWARYPSGAIVQIHGYCKHPEDQFCSVDATTVEDWSWLEQLPA